MKKLFGILLAVVMMFSVVAMVACSTDVVETGDIKVAMITDYGDITDQSFNQSTYEACKEWCDAQNVTFKYYKPENDSTEARVASVNQAIEAGYNTIVMPGYAFGATVVEVAAANSDVKFIALDVSQGDLGDNYTIPSNVTTFVYQEEYAGFMAGYAAVKEGYRHLGFLGGMAVPAVIRFGYGYVQGVNAAAKELKVTNDVTLEYVYGGKFFGTAKIDAAMETWYTEKHVEVVFASGGGIYTSACKAATKDGINGKVIGVDSDQSYAINGTGEGKYGEDVCITSAMKGLQPTVKTILSDLKAGKWNNYAGKVNNMGLVSGTDASLNYVQLPTATWSMKNFKVADYNTLVGKLFDKAEGFVVSGDTKAMPTVEITVNTYDTIEQ